jgi:S-formylglutathione hydrolase FrmB
VRKFTANSLLIVALTILAISAKAESRVDCSQLTSKILGRPVPYCVMLPPSYDTQKAQRYPVLYYLHGLGDNEESLINGGGWSIYEDQLAQKKVGEFLIVSPYEFRSFAINSRDDHMKYEEFFLREFMPAIEKKYRIKAGRGAHGIMGISMGGYGALHFAFKYPQMFISVSTHMAALRDTLPKNVESVPEGKLLGDIFGKPIDTAYYQANNPLALARKAPLPALKSMNVYFDCGGEDSYRFDIGAEELHKILQSRGVPHEFHIYPGGHDMVYVLQHFAASLQWHSRAFGPAK